eukprot:4236394-Pleurochrysis_carterae.AAC.1
MRNTEKSWTALIAYKTHANAHTKDRTSTPLAQPYVNMLAAAHDATAYANSHAHCTQHHTAL